MTKKIPRKSISFGDPDQQKISLLKRDRSTLVIYISLFTSILALFILITSLVELEPSTPKRNFQKMVNFLTLEAQAVRKQQNLDWINVENTFSKGVKITLSPDYFVLSNLFTPARAKINPFYVPYIRKVSEFIKAINIEQFPAKHDKLIKEIEAEGYDFMITVRIEGYTDGSPLAKTALYRDNLQLSTFRAYAMMDLIKRYTALPEKRFSIAGYGDRRPITADPMDAQNRRIEIYLLPQLMVKGTLL